MSRFELGPAGKPRHECHGPELCQVFRVMSSFFGMVLAIGNPPELCQVFWNFPELCQVIYKCPDIRYFRAVGVMSSFSRVMSSFLLPELCQVF